MRIVATSDLHGFLPTVDILPEGDLLIIAGDIMPMDHSYAAQRRFCDTFDNWLEPLSWRYTHGILGVAGNHDFIFDKKSAGKTFLGQYFYPDGGDNYARSMSAWTYLEHEMINIGGLTFYGTPYVPNLASWAFYSPESETERRFNVVGTADVIVSHGPPSHVCDRTRDGDFVGSQALYDAVSRLTPKLVVCGHIHEAFGKSGIGATDVYNVSYVNRDYRPTNLPVVIDI